MTSVLRNRADIIQEPRFWEKTGSDRRTAKLRRLTLNGHCKQVGGYWKRALRRGRVVSGAHTTCWKEFSPPTATTLNFEHQRPTQKSASRSDRRDDGTSRNAVEESLRKSQFRPVVPARWPGLRRRVAALKRCISSSIVSTFSSSCMIFDFLGASLLRSLSSTLPTESLFISAMLTSSALRGAPDPQVSGLVRPGQRDSERQSRAGFDPRTSGNPSCEVRKVRVKQSRG